MVTESLVKMDVLACRVLYKKVPLRRGAIGGVHRGGHGGVDKLSEPVCQQYTYY